MRRVTPLVTVLLAAALAVAPAHAQEMSDEPPTEARAEERPDEVHDIVFPVVGDVSYTDTFGAARGSGRSHEGQDLMGTKMLELVAADAGVLTIVTWPQPSYGYYVKLTADDGWSYSYVHLNNDTPGTDDNAAAREDVYGPGIVEGARVERGQLLGYMGDSGNAEHTQAHLHFEMHDPSGRVVNPMASLDAAQRVDAPLGATAEPSPIPRLAGADRVATAIAVAGRGWRDGAEHVVLADGSSYAESLPASVLATARGGPLLLETAAGLSDEVAAELGRLGARTVTVVGSVSPAVDDDLGELGIAVSRLGAAGDALSTAAAVAHEIGGTSGVAVLVNVDRFADGVSAAALAAANRWPILLTTTSIVPQVSVDAWRAIGIHTLVLMGGTGVIVERIEEWASESGRCAAAPGCTVQRVAGTDRYGTSVAAVERSIAAGGASVGSVLLGTGTNYPDTLASGPLAARLGGVALLVDGSGRRADTASRAFLSARAGEVGDVAILGGPGAVTTAADRAIQEALGID